VEKALVTSEGKYRHIFENAMEGRFSWPDVHIFLKPAEMGPGVPLLTMPVPSDNIEIVLNFRNPTKMR
jgi:hypothetical protein